MKNYLCIHIQPSYMKKSFLTTLFFLIAVIAFSQRIHIGVFGGAAAYNGDLTEELFPKKVTNGAIGLTINYEVTDQIIVRLGGTYAVVGGADRFSKDTSRQVRNLSFETMLIEGSLVGEYYLFNLYERRISPYAFAGVAVYSYNPYAYHSGQKVFLRPMSTEGQGLSGYPDRKPYSLTQLAIPFGGGVKFALTENLRVGLEGGMRKLFTDYLDDVSTNYVDEAELLTAKGQVAVDMSYRGDETFGSPTYPSKGSQRGSPKAKDYYYFAGVHLTYKIGSSGGGYGRGNKRGGRTGCPSVY